MVHVLEHPNAELLDNFDLQYRILTGDARQRMKDIQDETVHLVVTSPPYGRIKEYSNSNDEIGYNQSFEEYHNSLMEVFRECIRVLNPGCRMVINIGDEFVSTTKKKPYHVVPHNAKIMSNILSEFTDEIIYNGTILWKKVSTSNTSGGGKIMGSVYHPRNGHFFINYEHIMVFKKLGKDPRPEKWRKEESRFTLEERREWFSDTWYISPERQENHAAMFPIELPERLIQMYSFVGETVFDPFAGSGTTLAAAAKHGRSGLGIELGYDENWKDITRRKIEQELPIGNELLYH